MGEIKQMNSKGPIMEGRTCYDVMQKIITGERELNKASNIVKPDGKPATVTKEPVYSLRSLNLRCFTVEEAQGICRDLIQPGKEGEFLILPVYVVMSAERWKEIMKQTEENEGGN